MIMPRGQQLLMPVRPGFYCLQRGAGVFAEPAAAGGLCVDARSADAGADLLGHCTIPTAAA